MALSASDARLALVSLGVAGMADVEALLGNLETASPEAVRAALFEAVPEVVGYYSLGSAALAADWYDDLREEAGAPGRFTSEPVIPDRSEKIRNMLGWATSPLFAPGPDVSQVHLRLLPEVQKEIALPNRETMRHNVARDPAANGWQRVAAGGCKFCRFLAGRGTVYRKETARFASHPNCNCTAQPVFQGQPGEEASVLQYVASSRRANRTEKQRRAINEALAKMDDTTVSLTGKATGTAAKAKPSGAFESMTREQVQKQIDITRRLKDSEWRTGQLARLESRIAEL